MGSFRDGGEPLRAPWKHTKHIYNARISFVRIEAEKRESGNALVKSGAGSGKRGKPRGQGRMGE